LILVLIKKIELKQKIESIQGTDRRANTEISISNSDKLNDEPTSTTISSEKAEKNLDDKKIIQIESIQVIDRRTNSEMSSSNSGKLNVEPISTTISSQTAKKKNLGRQQKDIDFCKTGTKTSI